MIMIENNSAELLSAGKWTQFLESLAVGLTDWTLDNYKDLLSLRVTASILNKRVSCLRAYSIKVSKENDLKIYIEVSKKKPTFQDSTL